MSTPLARLLRQEQFAFLTRDHSAWGDHLDRVRAFLGEGLQAADPARPALVLGAGSGLEVPWALAPLDTTGWDADPWSRCWTTLRHRRWAPWVFEDLTGGLSELEAAVRRSVAEPWSGQRRSREQAILRLVGLLPSLHPDAAALRAWIAARRPGTILSANVMGQFGVVAERLVEALFGDSPWTRDPEVADSLAEALDTWTRRAAVAFLAVLQESGADLWLVHDRAVVFTEGALALGSWEDRWTLQLQGTEGLEVSDPLPGLDVMTLLGGTERIPFRAQRWLWPVAPGQQHLVEAVAFRARVAMVTPCSPMPRRPL
ncbi:MAG: hypothetical protein HGB30_06745 [Holophagaceae bacterium]|nr:hypothetical protein [Holophagaceae bacterium]